MWSCPWFSWLLCFIKLCYTRRNLTPITFRAWRVKQRRRRRRRQLERQKSNRFIVAKHQLCTCITLFCTFLCSHCTTSTSLNFIRLLWVVITPSEEKTTRSNRMNFRLDVGVKVPNFTFCQGREHKTTTFFLFSWTLIQSFRIQLQKKSPTFDESNEIN